VVGAVYTNWQKNIEKQVGALYDMTRKVMLTKRMRKRFRNNAIGKKDCEWQDIIPGLQSDTFKDIENEWKVHIPFNKKDMEVY
jgi:hypothetical protein